MNKTPCYFCDKDTPGRRRPGCHAECKDFKDWKSAEDEKKRKVIERSKQEGFNQFMSYQTSIKKRLLKKVGKS